MPSVSVVEEKNQVLSMSVVEDLKLNACYSCKISWGGGGGGGATQEEVG